MTYAFQLTEPCTKIVKIKNCLEGFAHIAAGACPASLGSNCARGALSRSASAAGTVLVQAFTEKKITAGISGYLHQDFRELEILNTITKRA